MICVYFIVDETGQYQCTEEYADDGEQEGWLEWISHARSGDIVYHYYQYIG